MTSRHDLAIWHTVHIRRLIEEGRLSERGHEPTTFPPSFHRGEHMLVAGEYLLAGYSAVGDGTYQRSHGTFLATGRGGLAMTAGFFAAQALGNSARKRAAVRDAQERWHPISAGVVHVSDHGFYLHNQAEFMPWNWESVRQMELVGEGQVHLLGDSTEGQVRWIIESDWAELIFVLWALARHPRHPQLEGRTWIPEGWVARMRAAHAQVEG